MEQKEELTLRDAVTMEAEDRVEELRKFGAAGSAEALRMTQTVVNLSNSLDQTRLKEKELDDKYAIETKKNTISEKEASIKQFEAEANATNQQEQVRLKDKELDNNLEIAKLGHEERMQELADRKEIDTLKCNVELQKSRNEAAVGLIGKLVDLTGHVLNWKLGTSKTIADWKTLDIVMNYFKDPDNPFPNNTVLKFWERFSRK